MTHSEARKRRQERRAAFVDVRCAGCPDLGRCADCVAALGRIHAIDLDGTPLHPLPEQTPADRRFSQVADDAGMTADDLQAAIDNFRRLLKEQQEPELLTYDEPLPPLTSDLRVTPQQYAELCSELYKLGIEHAHLPRVLRAVAGYVLDGFTPAQAAYLSAYAANIIGDPYGAVQGQQLVHWALAALREAR